MVTPNELGKISQNFLKMASAISDDDDSDADFDHQDYFSSYMNISQSPEEIQKQRGRGPPSSYTKKSILKKTNSSNQQQAAPERTSAAGAHMAHLKKVRKGNELFQSHTKQSHSQSTNQLL